MKLIYVHLNPTTLPFSSKLNKSDHVFSDLPNYAHLSIQQSKKLQYDVVIISDASPYFSQLEEFYEMCVKHFPKFANDPFWLLTLMRLYVVYLYAKESNLDRFIHMEYDNLVYKEERWLANIPAGCYFTQVGPQCGSAGFVYVNGFSYFEKFINRLKALIEKGQWVVQGFTQYDHLSEMIMIDLIRNHTGDIRYLPLFPDQEYWGGCVFDGASYGQFLGGIQGEEKAGWYGLHHHVGEEIQNGKISKICIKEKCPYVIHNNIISPIFNLHIHSKKLEKFVI